jgi:glycerol-3-phosphate dehydrogenase
MRAVADRVRASLVRGGGMSTIDVDVLIVGAGVVGCSIAARLSQDAVSVAVVERRHDVVDETSKSNTGVADCGWECEPGSLEADLILRSSPRWEEMSERFDAPFRRCAALSVARTDEEVGRIDEIIAAAAANGVRAQRLTGDEARALVPCIGPDVLAAIDVPDEGVIDSIRLTLGYAELAARNGARFFCNAPVVAAEVRDRRVQEVHTPKQRFKPRYVVNAAGLGADTVSRLLGGEEFRVWPRRGEYLLADREDGAGIPRVITQLPNPHTRGVMVVPSTHGSVLLGPTATDDDDKSDRSTHADVLRDVWDQCLALVPALADADVIKSFAGLRPASDRTYRVEGSERVANLVQACGVRSTGVSSSPAMGEHVRELLIDLGLACRPRAGALDRIPRRLRLAEALDCEALAGDPLGRTVVCACEKVTALEIHEALRGPVPARSIAGIAKRTRATWGRCQGSACLSGVSFIASLYHDGDAWSLPVSEHGATLGVGVAAHE